MDKQSDRIGTNPRGAIDTDNAVTAVPPKVWKSPQVIVGTLDDAETGTAAGPDSGLHS